MGSFLDSIKVTIITQGIYFGNLDGRLLKMAAVYYFFQGLGYLCSLMFIISMIKPKWGTFGKKPEWKRKKIAVIYFLLSGVFGMIAEGVIPADIKMANQQKREQQKIESQERDFKSKNVFIKDYGMSVEQAKKIQQALESVGLGEVKKAKKESDSLYALNVEAKNKDYTPNDGRVKIILNQGNIIAVKLGAINLYDNGKAISQINDYIISTGEQVKMQALAPELVKQYLKAPSTAKFDKNTYKFFKGKGIATMNGTVDAQNSFGAMIRTYWKIQFDCKNDMKPLHMQLGNQTLF